MKHGISEQEWNDYIEGLASAVTRDRIEAHLTACQSCWNFYEQAVRLNEALGEAGEEACRHLTLDNRQLHRLLRGTFVQLHREPAVTQSQVCGRLGRLKRVLTPFCGAEAAMRALQAAARHSPANSLDCVTYDNWEPFLERLAAIAAAMCGETFGSLVREQGWR